MGAEHGAETAMLGKVSAKYFLHGQKAIDQAGSISLG